MSEHFALEASHPGSGGRGGDGVGGGAICQIGTREGGASGLQEVGLSLVISLDQELSSHGQRGLGLQEAATNWVKVLSSSGQSLGWLKVRCRSGEGQMDPGRVGMTEVWSEKVWTSTFK